MELLLENSETIYLRANVPTLFERLLAERASRPMISSLSDDQLTEFIAKHLFERRNFYERAETTISIEGKSPEEIADEILHSR